MSSEDPLASAAEGVTKGFLGWTEEKIKGLARRFRDRDIAFVQNPETINLLKEQRSTSEWSLFREYVDDHDLHILFMLGLTLRKLENQPDQLVPLRDKIVNKYDAKGLHIAQFIQDGLFGKFLGNALERTSTPQKLRFEIKNLFDNIEQTVVFVKETDDVDKKTEEVVAKLRANSPSTFIICSSGYAKKKCEQIKEKTMKKISGYVAERSETQFKQIYFLNKSE
ncbi:MAG: hypothetical protein ABR962_07075 [Candidatus Bathyarchaeia archaeon]|jgi:hypothetical protein